jgi:hypothetical protein
MRSGSALGLLPLLAAAAYSVPVHERPAEDRIEAEYAVYSAVLDAFAEPVARRSVSFGSVAGLYPVSLRAHLVSECTQGELIFGLRREDLVLRAMDAPLRLAADLVADYSEANQVPRRLSSERFTARVPVRVLNERESAEIDEQTMDAAGYPEPLPSRGHVSFSRVGFSSDRRTATIFAKYRCGGRCGSGQVIVLQRERDQWQVVASEVVIHY